MPGVVAVSVHPARRLARRMERRVQALLDERAAGDAAVLGWGAASVPDHVMAELDRNPGMRGVKVIRAGRFMHVVLLTEQRGH